jgi:hypothetical protein
MGAQPLQMLDEKGRRRVSHHFAVRLVHFRVRDRGTGNVVLSHDLGDIHLHRVDRDRDLVWLRRELGQHVTRVVTQPLCLVPTLRAVQWPGAVGDDCVDRANLATHVASLAES